MFPTQTPFPSINIDPTAIAQTSESLFVGIRLIWDDWGLAILIVAALICLILIFRNQISEFLNNIK